METFWIPLGSISITNAYRIHKESQHIIFRINFIKGEHQKLPVLPPLYQKNLQGQQHHHAPKLSLKATNNQTDTERPKAVRR